jgi:hypothetical protein
MGRADAVDVMIVSLGSTAGLRRADDELQASIEGAGASVAQARALAPREVRTLMLTDLGWARAARAAGRRMLAVMDDHPPRAIVYSSTTAALLWPAAGAIRFDSPAAVNRPGRHGLWQRPLERLRLRQAPLLLPWSEGALQELEAVSPRRAGALVLPVPVEPSGPPEPVRDIAAIAYASNPTKKGIDRVLSAWRQVRGEAGTDVGGELLLAGVTSDELTSAGLAGGPAEGVRVVGRMPPRDYRALLRRARVFVCAPRREDHGIAQLEALADGCMVVTTPAPGPYVALPIARALDGRLVGEDLAAQLRTALEDPREGYATQALAALAPFRRQAVDRLVAERLLPRLLA